MGAGYIGVGMFYVVGSALNAMNYPGAAFSLAMFRVFLLFLPGVVLGARWFGLEGLGIGSALANGIIGVLSLYVINKLVTQNHEFSKN